MNSEEQICKVVNLSNNDILPNRFQPRKYFDEEDILQLSESIKEHGVINPIIVRKLGDKYELVAGERRYKANILAGNDNIPAIIMDVNDKESSEIAVVENIQRRDLNAVEEAISYKRILDIGYMTQEQLAQKMGKSQSAIANKIRLLKLSDDVQDALMKKQISERHARSLLKLSSQQKQNEMLKRIISERLTVRKTDEEIDKMNNNIYENRSDSLEPIMPVSTVTDVNISTIPNYDNAPSISPESININNQYNNVANLNNQNEVMNSQVQPVNQLGNIPPLSPINDSVIKDRSVGTSMSAESSIPMGPIPSLSPINEVSSFNNQSTVQSQNQQVGSVGNIPPLNPINDSVTKVPSVGTSMSAESSTPMGPIPSLSPINEFSSFNNSSTVQSQNNILDHSNTYNTFVSNNAQFNPLKDNLMGNNILPNNNKEKNAKEVYQNDTLSFATSPIIDTTISNQVNDLSDLNNLDSNIDDNLTPLSTTNNQFERVPEPIIVNDYNQQYDPIMPDVANQNPTIDFKTIISLIRKCSAAIENSGYKIETEEYNLDNLYQVVFKIEKK